MKQQNAASQLFRRRRRRKAWQTVVTSLAAFVVFITTYLLILPAVTAETDTYCGFEAHEHTQACYTAEQQLTCGLEESTHTHEASCYAEEQALICANTDETHEHAANCHTVECKLVCTQSEAHTHAAECTAEQTVLTCEVPEHTHADDCYAKPDDSQAEAETNASKQSSLGVQALTAKTEYEDSDLAKYITGVAVTHADGTALTDNAVTDGDSINIAIDFTFEEGVLQESQTMTYQLPTGLSDIEVGWASIDFTSGNGSGSYAIDGSNKMTLTFYVTPTDPLSARLLISGATAVNTSTDEENPTSTFAFGAPESATVPTITVNPITEYKFTATHYSGLTATVTVPAAGNAALKDGATVVIEPVGEWDSIGASVKSAANAVLKANGEQEDANVHKVYRIYLRDNYYKEYALTGDVKIELDWANSPYSASEVEKLKEVNLAVFGTDAQATPQTDYSTLDTLETSGETPIPAKYTYTGGFLQYWDFMVLYSEEKPLAEGEYDNYNFSYNYQKDAFTTDPAYAKFYNASSLLGVAGSFHMVAFDTFNVTGHMNGNVLAKNASIFSNYGTNEIPYELSYIQNYLKIAAANSPDGDAAKTHILVLGSDHTLKYSSQKIQVKNTNAELDGVAGAVERPYNIVQDIDTESTPFIDLVAVEAYCNQLSEQLAQMATTNVEEADGNEAFLKIVAPDLPGVYNFDMGTDPNALLKGLNILGFESDKAGSVIINVNCENIERNQEGETLIKLGNSKLEMDGKIANALSEVIDFSGGRVLWNFYNAEGLTIETQIHDGSVLAPEATVRTTQNLNGTVIAKNIDKKEGETHRQDFMGLANGVGVQLKAKKSVNNANPTDKQVFSFVLEELQNGRWTTKQTGMNTGGATGIKQAGPDIVFNALGFDEAGTYWYRICEAPQPQQTQTGYTLDTTQYVVKVVVSTGDNGALTAVQTYYNVNGSEGIAVENSILKEQLQTMLANYQEGQTDISDLLTELEASRPASFNNTTGTTQTNVEVTLKAIKQVDNAAPKSGETFRFNLCLLKESEEPAATWQLVDYKYNLVNANPNKASEITFAPQAFAEAGTYWLRIAEADEDSQTQTGYTLDEAVFIAKVEVSGNPLTAETTYYQQTGTQDALLAVLAESNENLTTDGILTLLGDDTAAVFNNTRPEAPEEPKETDGYTFPETGGRGTTPIFVAGASLMALCAAYLHTNRTKRRKEGMAFPKRF